LRRIINGFREQPRFPRPLLPMLRIVHK
jgi:hypothetical protein